MTDVNFRHNPSTLIQWNARPPVLQVRQSFVATYLYNLCCQKILFGGDNSVGHFYNLRKFFPCNLRYFVEIGVISDDETTK